MSTLLCKHEWLDRVALHATPRTPKALRLEEGELAFAVHLKSLVRDGVAIVTAVAMADRTGIPHRTVRRYLQAFESWKFIAVEWSTGGAKGHRISLLDASEAAVDRDWSKDRTRPLMSGRVADDDLSGENEPTRPLMDGRVTRPLHAGARKLTLTLQADGAPPQGPPSTLTHTFDVAEETQILASIHSSSSSLDEHAPDAALGGAAGARVGEQQEEDMSWFDAMPAESRTPVSDRFREEMNDFPRSFAELRAFARMHGLEVGPEELAELAEELGYDDDAKERQDTLADAVANLRAGRKFDCFGEEIVLPPRDGSAARMLGCNLRRADFVGRLCDEVERLPRGPKRVGLWKNKSAILTKSMSIDGLPSTEIDAYMKKISAEISAELVRREDKLVKELKEIAA